MKITLAPVGPASDVLPMIALGRALHDRGHIITICAAEEFRSRIYKAGFQMVSSGQTYRKYLECEGDFDDATTELTEILAADMALHFVALRDAIRDADLLVGARLQIAGPSMAEQYEIPYVYAAMTPGVADQDYYPIFGVPHDRLQKRRSKRTKEWDAKVLTALNRERNTAHLAPVTNLFEHVYRSGELLKAFDPEISGVKESTGSWLLDEDLETTPEILFDLENGNSPIYIAPFRLKDPKLLYDLCESLVKVGHRVRLGYGWTEISDSDLPDGCLLLNSLSFAQIFPKMSVVIHAGAPDVTMQALRAVVPQITLPHTVEQAFWANRSHALGVSPSPVLNGDLSKLEQSIKQTLVDASFRERAKTITIHANNGLAAATEVIEKVLRQKVRLQKVPPPL
jgi:sterol 3beta-glucosyltransferase